MNKKLENDLHISTIANIALTLMDVLLILFKNTGLLTKDTTVMGEYEDYHGGIIGTL